MSQKLPVNNFEWIENNSQFNEHFIKKTITKKVMKDTFLKLILSTLKYCMNIAYIMIYHFYLRGGRLKKVEKFVTNLHDKTEYVIHIRYLKRALIHGLVLKKVHRLIKFNQNAWLNSYIDKNIDLSKKAKNDFECD